MRVMHTIPSLGLPEVAHWWGDFWIWFGNIFYFFYYASKMLRPSRMYFVSDGYDVRTRGRTFASTSSLNKSWTNDTSITGCIYARSSLRWCHGCMTTCHRTLVYRNGKESFRGISHYTCSLYCFFRISFLQKKWKRILTETGTQYNL